MLIDFTALRNQTLTVRELSARFTLDDLRAAADAYVDAIQDIIKDTSDAQIAYVPVDSRANDPYAVPGEETIGWSLGHLVAHTTASTEEGAAFASLLACGIQLNDEEQRLRYETPWQEIDTKARALQRLEESRRMRRAYFDTWPDRPHLDVYRKMRPRFTERFGPVKCARFGAAGADARRQSPGTVPCHPEPGHGQCWHDRQLGTVTSKPPCRQAGQSSARRRTRSSPPAVKYHSASGGNSVRPGRHQGQKHPPRRPGSSMHAASCSLHYPYVRRCDGNRASL